MSLRLLYLIFLRLLNLLVLEGASSSEAAAGLSVGHSRRIATISNMPIPEDESRTSDPSIDRTARIAAYIALAAAVIAAIPASWAITAENSRSADAYRHSQEQPVYADFAKTEQDLRRAEDAYWDVFRLRPADSTDVTGLTSPNHAVMKTWQTLQDKYVMVELEGTDATRAASKKVMFEHTQMETMVKRTYEDPRRTEAFGEQRAKNVDAAEAFVLQARKDLTAN